MKNGSRAIALTDYPGSTCWHWRESSGLSDAQLVEQFETAQAVSDPHVDTSLIYDPAPVEHDPEGRKRQLELSPATSALRALEKASPIDGWMDLLELSFLYELARTMPDDARVAEVGSWKGRSTVAICEGLRTRANPSLYAVDWFAGDPQVHAQVGDVNPTTVETRSSATRPAIRLHD
jgi:hypothetical protein